MEPYTSRDASKFDPVMREYEVTAWTLFWKAADYLSFGSDFENIELDTECATGDGGRTHSQRCRIKMVTVRRRSSGAESDDVVGLMLVELDSEVVSDIREAHDRAFL